MTFAFQPPEGCRGVFRYIRKNEVLEYSEREGIHAVMPVIVYDDQGSVVGVHCVRITPFGICSVKAAPNPHIREAASYKFLTIFNPNQTDSA